MYSLTVETSCEDEKVHPLSSVICTWYVPSCPTGTSLLLTVDPSGNVHRASKSPWKVAVNRLSSNSFSQLIIEGPLILRLTPVILSSTNAVPEIPHWLS